VSGKLFLIVGPSGVGKGTLTRALAERHADFVFPPSVTTRAPREHEVSGGQYLFVSEAEMDNYIAEGELLEWAVVHGEHRYGTLRQPIERAVAAGQTVLREVDIQGLKSIQQNLAREKFVSFFIVPPDLAALKRRILQRQPEMPESELMHRLASAEIELAQKELADYVLVSDDGKIPELIARAEELIAELTEA
jgi:guanylate kinase